MPMADEPQTHFSSVGPLDGPVLIDGHPGIVPIFDSPTCQGLPIGTAHSMGLVTENHALVQIFRLKIQGQWMKALWVCDRRVFVRLSARKEIF